MTAFFHTLQQAAACAACGGRGRTSSAMAKLNFSTSSVMRWSAFVSPAAHQRTRVTLEQTHVRPCRLSPSLAAPSLLTPALCA